LPVDGKEVVPKLHVSRPNLRHQENQIEFVLSACWISVHDVTDNNLASLGFFRRCASSMNNDDQVDEVEDD
jgi:hypothetical protein